MEKSFGVVLDLSLAHEADGRRRLDHIKEQLIGFIKSSVDDVEDSMYFYHPNLTDLMYKNGDEVSAVSNYETDGWVFNISNALKQAIYVLGMEDEDFSKVIVLITDRIDSDFALKKAVKINETTNCGCKFVIIGVGNRYSKDLVSSFAKANSVVYRHCDEGRDVGEVIQEAIVHAESSVQTESDEFSG